jgi:hypothetical protein
MSRKKQLVPSILALTDEDFYTFAIAYATNSSKARLVCNRDHSLELLPLSKLKWIKDIIVNSDEHPLILMYNQPRGVYIGVCTSTGYTVHLPLDITSYTNH